MKKKVFNRFPLYFFYLKLNFSGVWGHNFNNSKSTQSEGACLPISQIIALKFLRRTFRTFFPMSNVNLSLGPSIGSWGHGFNHLEFTLSENVCILISHIVAILFLRKRFLDGFLLVKIENPFLVPVIVLVSRF